MQLIKEPEKCMKTRFWLRKPTEEEQKKNRGDGNE